MGPAEIRDRPRGAVGTPIRSFGALLAWLEEHPDGVSEGATFVVDVDGVVRLAPRRSEHIDCAGGGDVLAAGEISLGFDGCVIGISNQSMGYCPDPSSWAAVSVALVDAGIPGPSAFTRVFDFRRCTECGMTNLVKEGWFVCAGCDVDLPNVWNFENPDVAHPDSP